MSDVVSWVVEAAIKPGKLDKFKGVVEELVQSTKSNEPNTLVYEYFLSNDNGSCHIYERFADSAAAMVHLTTFGQRFAERFLAAADLTRVTVYGNANEEVRNVLGGFGASFMSGLDGFAR
jgi:quinol monooxygenase YgiN